MENICAPSERGYRTEEYAMLIVIFRKRLEVKNWKDKQFKIVGRHNAENSLPKVLWSTSSNY